MTGEDEQVLVRHGPGRFLGELNLITGMRVFVSTRVVEPGEVLVVPRGTVCDGSSPPCRSSATRSSPPSSHAARSSSPARPPSSESWGRSTRRTRCGSVSSWPDSAYLTSGWTRIGIQGSMPSFSSPEYEPDELPVVITATSVLRRATPGELAVYLGLTVDNLPERVFDLVVVGGGPAGLATAVYGASEGLAHVGRRHGQRRRPGGIELADRELSRVPDGHLRRRSGPTSGRTGREVRREPHQPVRSHVLEGGRRLPDACELSDGTEVTGRAVVVATGASYRRSGHPTARGVRGQRRLLRGHRDGSTPCATSPVVVVGWRQLGGTGGDLPCPVGQRGDHRHPWRRPRCPHVAVPHGPDRCPPEDRGSDEVSGHRPRRRSDASPPPASKDRTARSTSPVPALFSFIGADPASGWISGCAALDDHGFVLTDRQLDDEDLGETLGACSVAFRCPTRPVVRGSSPWATSDRARSSGSLPPSARGQRA